MLNKIFIGLGVLVLLVVIGAGILIYNASGWEERSITDTLGDIDIITNNIGAINKLSLDSESNKWKTRKASIIAEGVSGQAILTGTITPLGNKSEFLFKGVVKLPQKSYALEFLYSGTAQNKGSAKYKYDELKTDSQSIN